MADDFDGSEFVGLDDNLFGDGSTDANTRMLDTYAENRLDGNLRYQQQRGSQASYSFFVSPIENIRPFASDHWSCLLAFPWYLSNDVDTLTWKVFGEVKNDLAGTTGQLNAEMRVYLADQIDDPLVSSSTSTWTATSQVDVYETSIDLSSESLPYELGLVTLWIQSANDGVTIVTYQDTYLASRIQYDDAGSIDAEITPTSSMRSDGQSAEIWHTSPAFGSEPPQQLSGIEAGRYLGPPGRSQMSLQFVELSYIEPQSAVLQADRQADTPGGGYTPKNAWSMRAQRPVLGSDVSHHGTNADAVHAKPRVIGLGPAGQDDGVDWPTGEYRKWSWVNLTQTSDTLLDRQPLQVRASDSQIECHFLLIGFWEGVENGFVTQTNEAYAKDLMRGSVNFTVTVDQLEGGDASWASAGTRGSETQQKDVFFYRDEPAEAFPLAQQFYWARHPEGSDDFVGSGAYRYTYREGQLLEKDMPRVFGGMASITVDAADITTTAPVRGRLEVDGFTGLSPQPGHPDWTHRFHVLCLQTTWMELP